MADLTVPTSSVAHAAAELARDASPPFLFNHGARTFAWAVLIADKDRIAYDRELLYIGAILHDIGLTPSFDGPRCFENEGGAAAAAFAPTTGTRGPTRPRSRPASCAWRPASRARRPRRGGPARP